MDEMTKEKAIEYLQGHYLDYRNYVQEDMKKIELHNASIDLAIKALQMVITCDSCKYNYKSHFQ